MLSLNPEKVISLKDLYPQKLTLALTKGAEGRSLMFIFPFSAYIT